MAWIYLGIAGLFEVAWAIGLKYTNGFTHVWWSLWTIATMAVSFGLLSLAMKVLPVGTAYAVWTGIGAVGTVILGIVLFGDSASFLRLACIALVVCGMVGLKFESSIRQFLSPVVGVTAMDTGDPVKLLGDERTHK